MPQIYKKKLGLWMRWGTFAPLALLFLFGAYRLFIFFPVSEVTAPWLHEAWYATTIDLIGLDLRITPVLLISLSLAAALLAITWYFCFFHQRVSEFLIDTESEMRKVSWPTTKEVINSSIVVIIAILVLGVFLYFSDVILNVIFRSIFY